MCNYTDRMASNKKKENKKWIIGLIIGVVVIAIILFWLFEINPKSNNDTNYKKISSDLKETAGLYDIVKVVNLSYKLDGVYLDSNSGRYSEYYYLTWHFEVTNDGDTIENVSNCGVLLFEDGSQYNFDISQNDIDISGICSYNEMVPGAKMDLYSIFYFSDPSYHPKSWSGYPITWEKVSGSKITYFSQQNKGLVKFIIDKREIVNINQSAN